MNADKLIRCPACGNEHRWNSSDSFRPFCSQRCKDRDFIGWANEQHRIAGSSDYSDLFSEEMDEGNSQPRDC